MLTIANTVGIDYPPINSFFDYSNNLENVKLQGTNTGNKTAENGVIGIWDSRQPISIHDTSYNAVGALHTEDGQCTATIVTLEGYSSLNNSPIIATAAHCDSPVSFETTYKGDKEYVEYYESDIEKTLLYDEESDIALYSLRSPIPDDIKPILFKIDSDISRFSRVDAVGLSSDKKGLSAHFNCLTKYNDLVDGHDIITSCDLYTGASGGPLLHNGEIIAINSQISNIVKSSHHAILSSDLIAKSGEFYKTQIASLAPK